ncbi:MAG: branched-chain amino acid ABC transporter permease [Ruminococcaceae bacterium]|nr:branched-chain amino acid ABC transporter permease [Oscillospiraceae bacterium]
MNSLIQLLIDGTLTGGIYACVAIGLSLSFGIMRIFNWAQGDTYMMAMFILYVLIGKTSIHPYLAILIMVPLMFLYGSGLQKYILNPLVMRTKDRESLDVMLTTAGISYIIFNLATFIFGANAKSVATPVSGKMFDLGVASISQAKVYAFIAILCVTVGLELLLRKTEIGRALRATSQDKETAQLMGMNNVKLYNLANALNHACVGLAACVMIPMYTVSPASGQTFGFKSLIVVVLGGKGSVPGALLGGIIIGLVETLGAYYFNNVIAQMMIFGLFALILFLKPNGLLSKEKS